MLRYPVNYPLSLNPIGFQGKFKIIKQIWL